MCVDIYVCFCMQNTSLGNTHKKCLVIVTSARKRLLESGVKGRLIYTVYLFVQIEFFATSVFYFSSEKKN